MIVFELSEPDPDPPNSTLVSASVPARVPLLKQVALLVLSTPVTATMELEYCSFTFTVTSQPDALPFHVPTRLLPPHPQTTRAIPTTHFFMRSPEETTSEAGHYRSDSAALTASRFAGR